MSYKSLYLKPLQKHLKALLAEKHPELAPFKSTITYHLMDAAFGFRDHDIVRKLNVPFMSYAGSAWRNPEPNLNDSMLIKQIKTLLEVDEWKAQHIALDIKEAIRESHVEVDRLRVLLDPQYSEAARKQIFTALRNDFLPPNTASQAIADGKLPGLPAKSIGETLHEIRHKPQSFFSYGTLANFMADGPTYILRFPSPRLSEASISASDSFEAGSGHGQIGLGFVLIQPVHLPNTTIQRYNVLTFLRAFHPRAAKWSDAQISLTQAREPMGTMPPLGYAIEGGLHSLPLLTYCEDCEHFSAPDAGGIGENCLCQTGSIA